MIISMTAVAPALACGGLIGANGSVNLLRTATFVGYKDGIEHYVTSFEFAGGGGGEFGSIVPLPGIPTDVIKGGDWTLQRLEQETQPVVARSAALSADFDAGAAEKAEVLIEKRIDSLDVTILKGGGVAVGEWAEENGFNLPPDAPEVLEFYADRSPIFMAAKFDADAALEQGFGAGDGTPVHLVIPTQNPWVPLRILALGKQPNEPIEADVYLMAAEEMAMLPKAGPTANYTIDYNQAASRSLLRDLRSDRGMKWLPRDGMWLSYLNINTTAGRLTHDLALDASEFEVPSPRAAGLEFPKADLDSSGGALVWIAVGLGAAGALYLIDRSLMRLS